MIDCIRHRGPDGAGGFVSDGVALGMTRLAIVDIEHGGQPKTAADGRFVLVMNGEIYNHRILREQLLAEGHRFVSHSDTEVAAVAFAGKGSCGV